MLKTLFPVVLAVVLVSSGYAASRPSSLRQTVTPPLPTPPGLSVSQPAAASSRATNAAPVAQPAPAAAAAMRGRPLDTNEVAKPKTTLMSLAFDLRPTGKPLHGSILRGKGFRVWADWQASPGGTLMFLFQQMYRGLPINEWSGGTGFPSSFESGLTLDVPLAAQGPVRVACLYDLHTIQLSLSDATGVLTNYVLWRDNMTDALGSDGPDGVVVDHPAVSHVEFTPATPIAASRYVWEGVIGNTSHAPVGPEVHSTWWPISKMVSRGSNVFYTGGYNEGKWDIQKFDIANPQLVVTNFSANGRKQTILSAWPVDLAYPDDRTLLVKYSDGNIVAFDPVTTAKLAEHLESWPSAPALQVPLDGSSAVAVHPADNNVAAVYYHTTDQVVVYQNATVAGGWMTNFVIGAPGGYASGPSVPAPTNTLEFRSAVKLSGFYYDSDGTTNADARITNAVLCFQSDGKLWVGDTLTSRMLRFDAAGLCDAWFMFVAHTYHAYVDPNDPKRVFTGYLEFEVDYTNALSNAWTLKNCWTRDDRGIELPRRNSTQNGLFSVVTLTNGVTPQTFAFICDGQKLNRRHMVELTPRGVRATGMSDCSPLVELDPDGSVVTMNVGPTPQTGTTAYFYRDTIAGWSGVDPAYQRTHLGTVEYIDNVCPIYWNAAKLRGSKLFLFYPSKNQFERDVPAVPFTGSHLGAVDLAKAGTWEWLGAPTGPLDGRGTFETNCHYAGSGFTVVDDDIFFFYRGEGWRGGQASQIFHYKTDGTFVGQFGTPSFVQGTLLNAPGAGANAFNISAVKVDGVVYLYTSDEWSHGVHRWRVDPN